jgi:glycosyltransferase involved in cell wall biosynthesis
MKLISIVVPVLNEDKNVKRFYTALLKVITTLEKKYLFEILFTDNHSEDDTFKKIQELKKNDNRVRVIRFSKNFGYQKSILIGYLRSKGDAVVQIDCDLQDPPLMIKEFIKYWEQGYDVVYGIRITRKESIILKGVRKLFYRFINMISDDNLPLDAGDFRLVDKKIISNLSNCYDQSPYIRGLISSMGYNQIGIPYNRDERIYGESKFRISQLANLAVDGILNHSVVPLRISLWLGLILSLASFLLVIYYMFCKIFLGVSWPSGFASIAVISLFGIGITSLFLGVIGEYVGRIYRQVKYMPIVFFEHDDEI